MIYFLYKIFLGFSKKTMELLANNSNNKLTGGVRFVSFLWASLITCSLMVLKVQIFYKGELIAVENSTEMFLNLVFIFSPVLFYIMLALTFRKAAEANWFRHREFIFNRISTTPALDESNSYIIKKSPRVHRNYHYRPVETEEDFALYGVTGEQVTDGYYVYDDSGNVQETDSKGNPI